MPPDARRGRRLKSETRRWLANHLHSAQTNFSQSASSRRGDVRPITHKLARACTKTPPRA
eukprot:8363855-Alexandrium_andersonii.AAC.1